MKKDVLKIVLLILVLIVTSIVVTSTDSKYKHTILPDGTYSSNHITDSNWEYIKDRLFSGKGEAEFVFKLNQLEKKAPILIDLQGETYNDSLTVDSIIKELRTIIPNKTIDIFKNFAGKTFDELNSIGNEEMLIKGYSFSDLRFSCIKLKFGEGKSASLFDEIIKTVFPDGSNIERTNPPREERYIRYPSQVWFHLKDSLPYDKRQKYIKYELLRTLCFIYPNNSNSRLENVPKGIFSLPNYIPDEAKFNEQDRFLLQKLYADDFLEQFRDYLSTTYSWRYANNFLDKDLTKMITWVVIICMGLFVFLLSFSFLQSKKFKYSYLNYFLPLLFIMLNALNFTLIYAYLTDLGVIQVLTLEAILPGYLLAIMSSLIISFSLWLIEKMWINNIKNFSFQLLSKVIFTFIAFNLPIVILFIIDSEKRGFLEFYMPILIFIIIMAISRGLLIYLNHFSDSLVKEKDVELSQLKQANAEAEVKILQSQINPHFLYNALNSIASLAHTSADKTEKMALSLSDLFKYTINRQGKTISTVNDELDMVRSYLEIEQTRFGDRLEFVINAENDVLNEEIPMFILQPLVENAVKHGVSKIEDKGLIKLDILKTDKGLNIEVIDNGPNFPEGLVSGHGLQTVYDLLRLSYGDKSAIKWQNMPHKSISISIDKTA
ncbi:sensor histidine kinase [Mariniflexile sp. HMF6888]|uniref:sensor histidine kinase n=1 Tax=Mariniflexile sp. HMF6888 TaxID=3373086 RepID=UPI0037A73986